MVVIRCLTWNVNWVKLQIVDPDSHLRIAKVISDVVRKPGDCDILAVGLQEVDDVWELNYYMFQWGNVILSILRIIMGINVRKLIYTWQYGGVGLLLFDLRNEERANVTGKVEFVKPDGEFYEDTIPNFREEIISRAMLRSNGMIHDSSSLISKIYPCHGSVCISLKIGGEYVMIVCSHLPEFYQTWYGFNKEGKDDIVTDKNGKKKYKSDALRHKALKNVIETLGSNYDLKVSSCQNVIWMGDFSYKNVRVHHNFSAGGLVDGFFDILDNDTKGILKDFDEPGSYGTKTWRFDIRGRRKIPYKHAFPDRIIYKTNKKFLVPLKKFYRVITPHDLIEEFTHHAPLMADFLVGETSQHMSCKKCGGKLMH